ncbi:Immunity protein Imm1 [Tumidithrix helvetica PCC 7403]|uniref:Imm1 family immunity protein n=1 Tax=Tumidithrix helvetica TaxID=3457545 RepID=UPI003CADA6B3
MFISKFSIEDWQNNKNYGSLEVPSGWGDIEAAIRKLDGDRRTLVTLEADGETHMAIGGGTNKYLVYLTFDNENFNYLVNPSKSDRTETLVVGGQEGIYPAKWCVDLTTTLKAAKAFAEFGTIEKSVVWERDGVPEMA